MSGVFPLQINRNLGLALCALLLQACVAVDDGPTQEERASSVNVQLGIGYLQQNKLELASEKLSKALRQDPESSPAHNAYAILQDRLGETDLAEYHYEKATELDPKDAQAANNYGTFLCRNGRELESEQYFLRALDNPLYSTPEFAYTNAAICLMKVNENESALDYLRKALAERSDFAPALLNMSKLKFEQGDYQTTQVYLDRFHLVAQPTALSLWLSIRCSLELDPKADVSELVRRLGTEYPESREYELWKAFE